MSDLIRELQRALAVPVDGAYGPVTHRAAMARIAPQKPAEGQSGGSAGGQPQDAFTRDLAVILRHEGGYVNHPKDPGGRTNLGVTQRVWEAWTGKPASEAEMRALTPEKVGPVYRQNYWDKLHCDDLPPALALCVFDFGVNAGPARAARYLQQLAGAMQDGVIGGATVAAVKAWVARVGEAGAVKTYQDARRHYYKRLPTFATFGRGWLRRVDETETEALRLIP